MKTSEDTKSGPSVVAATLRSLSEQARVCHEKIDQLEAAQSVNRGEVLAEVGKLLDVCQNLRDAILSEDGTASWRTSEELNALVSRLDEAASKRRRYLELAQYLAGGQISHRRERTRQERLALRDAAVAELVEISEMAAPPELPGPEAEIWLEWACSLEDDTNVLELQKLKTGFPRLDDFVRQLEIDWWSNGPVSAAPAKRQAPVPVPAPFDEPNGSHLHGKGNGNGAFKTRAIEPLPIVEEEAPVPAPYLEEAPQVEEQGPAAPVLQEASGAATEEIEEPQSAAESDQRFPLLDDAQEEVLPAETLNPSRNGKVSLFPWDQVDQFTSHIAKARVERRELRTVRALLAVSHWLEPKEHNPLTHSKCGIRALTEHVGGADFEWVSPNDVMQAIALDDGIPLLTGGADLLRWGLLQPSERNFQGIASIQRLTREHLRAWFSEIYRIALSDKQIDDIGNLTSGIPILVGELHKLIIPTPEDPPTWLGLARWIEIKAQFEQQIPNIAHELKKGTPAVRLTDREISLLNMIALASPNSTQENLIANLSNNWEQYQHPEYRAFSSRDEVSLAVLMDLGLLPKRLVTGVEPSRAILPLRPEDAVHKIIQHL